MKRKNIFEERTLGTLQKSGYQFLSSGQYSIVNAIRMSDPENTELFRKIYPNLVKELEKNKTSEKSLFFSKELIIEINKKLGKEFSTEFGLGANKSNLDYALTLKEPYNIAKEILRGHPFIDGNKRTSFMIYLLLTTDKSYEEILNDYYDIFLSLSK